MARVFVIREPRRKNARTGAWELYPDITPAAEYGQLVYMLPPGRIPMDDVQPTVHALARFLDGYTLEDYILPVGDPTLIGIAAALAARAGNGFFRMLYWDNPTQQYYVADVDVDYNRSIPKEIING